MNKGLFITVEGTDGSGKSTQIALMADYLAQKGKAAVLTREPGGTIISEKIRAIILNPEHGEMCPAAEMLLYASARAQLVHEVIRPSVEEGKVVVCDRFLDSNFVYQGFGRGLGLDAVAEVNRIALGGLTPDITFFFDLEPEAALKRRVESTGADRIEKEDIEFHRRVYSGYKKLCEMYPQRIKAIDANRSVGEIAEDVRAWIDILLEGKT